MSEVFISYARTAAAAAARIAEALRAEGFGVWLDDDLPAHRAYDEVIEERLRAANAVLVLWSADAVKSQWVRAEADLARQAGTLVQATLDGTTPPLPFGLIHSADLSRWNGATDAAIWRKVVASIAELHGVAAAPAKSVAARTDAPATPLVGVLAFDNLSADPEMDYFSDGISEDILQAVSRLRGVRVIGRASSFQFRGAAKAERKVVSQLGATHLLDGSVRRSGQRVRISASLTECATHTSLWSGRFDRDLSDVFVLQDEIAAAVATALETVFSPAAAAQKVDPRAYDLYLKARSLGGSPHGNAECLRLLEEAVSLSPGFAAAWASLALARAIQLRWRPKTLSFEAARAGLVTAAHEATALDASLGLPYVALAQLEPPAAYQRREALLERALAASPDDIEILRQVSSFKSSIGRLDEAFGLITQAHEADPLNRIAAVNHASLMAEVGRVDESYEAYERARERWPDFDWLVSAPLLTAALLSDWKRVEPLLALAQRFPGEQMRVPLATVALLMGPQADARGRVRGIAEHQLARWGEVELRMILFAYTLGMHDEAWAFVDRSDFRRVTSVESPLPDRDFLQSVIFNVTNAAMRLDPRFPGFCAKLALCDYWVATERWPDCADQVGGAYDFRAAARRLARSDSSRAG